MPEFIECKKEKVNARSKRLACTITPELYEVLKTIAKEMKYSVNELINQSLTDMANAWLSKQTKNKGKDKSKGGKNDL